MEEREKVGYYIRTSTMDQTASLEKQLEHIKQYCDKKGYEMAWGGADEVSGHESVEKRPVLNKLLKDQERFGFAKIVCWKGERAFRNAAESLTYRQTLRKKGCIIVGVQDPLEDDGSAEAALVLGLTAVTDEAWRNKVRDRVKANHRHKASLGIHQGGIPPFGYKSVRKLHVVGLAEFAGWVPDDLAFSGRTVAEWLQFIFEEFLRHPNATAIAETLTNQGVPSPAYLSRFLRLDEVQRKIRQQRHDRMRMRQIDNDAQVTVRPYPPNIAWDQSTITSQILRNRAYLGEITFQEGQGKNYLRALPKVKNWRPGRQEPLISTEVFNQVQAILDSRSQAHRKPAQLTTPALLGQMIVCGRCGRAVSRLQKNSTQVKYLCNTARTSRGTRCQEHRYNSKHVDVAATKLLHRGVRARREMIVRNAANSNPRGKAVQASELQGLLAQKERLKQLYVKGFLDEAEFDADMGGLLAQIEVAKSKFTDEAGTVSVAELEELIDNIDKHWNAFSVVKKRRILQAYVPKGFTLSNNVLSAVVCGVPLEVDVEKLPPPTKGMRYGGRSKSSQCGVKSGKMPGSTKAGNCGGVTPRGNPAAPTEGNERPSLGTASLFF